MSSGKKVKSSVMIHEDVWKEIRILAIRENKEIGELVEEVFRERLARAYQSHSQQQKQQEDEDNEVQPIQQSHQLSQEELSKLIKEQFKSKHKSFHFVGPAPTKDFGYKKAELILFLPGLNFPVNKNELIQYLKRVEKEKKVDTIPLLLNILEKSSSSQNKVYDDKDRLSEDIVKTINANKEIKIGNRLTKELDNSQIIGCLIGAGKDTNEPKLEEFLKNLV